MATLACSSNGKEGASPAVIATTAATVPAAVTAAPVVEPTKPSAAATPTSLPAGTSNDEAVAFGAADGAILRGHLFSVPGPKRRVVIFVAPAQEAWRTQALSLVGPGTDVLLFDMRGYGASTERADPGKLDLDVEAAVRFMRSRDYALYYLVGADVGGTASLKVAARQDLALVVTISAPLSVPNGIDARADLAAISEPKVFIAARGDVEAVNAVNAMMQAAPQPKEGRIVEGSAHGAALLDATAAKQLQADVLAR